MQPANDDRSADGQPVLGAASLTVSGSGIEQIRESFGNLEFSTHFKALKKLDLRHNTTIPTLRKGCDDLFSPRRGGELNAAISQPGQDLTYQMFNNPLASKPEILAIQALVKELTGNDAARSSIRQILSGELGDILRRPQDNWEDSLKPHLNQLFSAFQSLQSENGSLLRSLLDNDRKTDTIMDSFDRYQYLSWIDYYQGLAETSKVHSLAFPDLNEENRLRLVEAVNPSIEGYVPIKEIDSGNCRIIVIGGYNGKGKTTIMATVSLAINMAQMGGGVFAQHADLPVVGQMQAVMRKEDENLYREVQQLSGWQAYCLSMGVGFNGVTYHHQDDEPPKGLIFFDDLGGDTDPFGQTSALVGVCNEVWKDPNLSAIITIHNPNLLKELEDRGIVANFHVLEDRTVEPGIATGSGAVAILKEQLKNRQHVTDTAEQIHNSLVEGKDTGKLLGQLFSQ